MIDISNEDLLTLSEAAKLLPGHPHLSTIHRWRLRGARGVRLETVVIGGRRYTSQSALEEFVAKTTAASDGSSVSIQHCGSRANAIAQAEKELSADGI